MSSYCALCCLLSTQQFTCIAMCKAYVWSLGFAQGKTPPCFPSVPDAGSDSCSLSCFEQQISYSLR